MGSVEPPKSEFNIVIIGAGIGGLGLAIGLLKQNVPFTLYEAAGAYSAIGAGVGLGPNALRAMDMIDKRFKSLYDGISTGNLTPNKEHVMMDLMPLEEGLGGDNFVPIPVQSPSYIRTSAHRRDLLDIMTSLIPLDTVKFNKRVKSYEQLEGRVAITFEDGETVEASAVIGCDGAKGATRGAVLGEAYPDQVTATYSGKYVYRSIVPMKEAIKILGKNAGDGKWFMGNGANFTTFSISKGAQFNIVAFKIDDKPWTHHQWTKMVDRETMLADFAVGWAEPLQWSIHHHLNTPVYYNGLICLLGDSAHATTPHQASGAGQCLEDSLVLSILLGLVQDSSHIQAAFQAYDEIRRPRAQEVVRTSQEAGLIYTYQDPVIGSDIHKVAENLNKRFLWIWEHDLEADVNTGVSRFHELIASGSI
ncbi:hypothetical protein OIDMADRAFT_132800 [Oidiodendron maius Zn]|uniref:FAD-binding domain-containing protein n=1 Tax=Oidiodendron maius (strain Zn) TaxID=913774 RepID=A0A0C3GJ83_OIDMZ|nr:hypothetical protein OIDMADRAFT_132800 [Oidiodendron maius Zn]